MHGAGYVVVGLEGAHWDCCCCRSFGSCRARLVARERRQEMVGGVEAGVVRRTGLGDQRVVGRSGFNLF